jgi:hypothetical protein
LASLPIVGNMTRDNGTPPTRGKRVEPCVIESFGRLGSHFLLVLDQAVHLSTKYNSDLSGGTRSLKDEWLTDISATICKTVARNYRNSIVGSQSGDPPIQTLFPATNGQPHPLARLQTLQSPLTRGVNNAPCAGAHVWPAASASPPLASPCTQGPSTEFAASPGTLAVRLLQECALDMAAHAPSPSPQALVTLSHTHVDGGGPPPAPSPPDVSLFASA